jgi:CheY-like chemotaxis protein
MRVLYVDDDRVNAILFAEVCRLAGGIELECASSGSEAQGLLAEFVPELLVIDLHLGDTSGERLLLKAYRREEIYRGPYLDLAADIILAPANGYDPKGALAKETFTYKDKMMVGMHTYDDAMLYIGGRTLPPQEVDIRAVMPTILHLLDVPAAADLDEHSLLG